MAANIGIEMEKDSFWSFKGQADYVDSWFLMGSPVAPLIILSTYLVFVLRIGPAWMKNRPPLKLTNTLLVYNFAQVLLSVYLCNLGFRNFMTYGIFNKTCLFEQEDIRKEILGKCYWYVMAKFTELLDTVFFVLRKKDKQVSFLHLYHHTFVAGMAWTLVKYGKIDDLVFGGTVNSFVHIWMYIYYGLAAFPSLRPYLWWKKYLTRMQLVQFVAVLVQIGINTVTASCPPSLPMLAMCVFNGFLFIYLFSDFYIKAYKKPVKPVSNKKDDDIIKKQDSATASLLKNSEAKWKR